MVWRHGAMCAAQRGSVRAGHLESDDLQRLRRALERYERHAASRPSVFPAGGLAVLVVIAAVADHHQARPETLHYAIRVLDQLSRRMRAAATRDDVARRDRAEAGARRRLLPDPASAGQLKFAFRTDPSPWPHWVCVDDAGHPLLEDGELVLTDQAGLTGAPSRNDPWYLATLRDAQLLAGLWPAVEADGRTAMAVANDSDYDAEAGRWRARYGPYGPPPDRRAQPEADDLRLAQLADIALRDVQRLGTSQRDAMLADHTARCDVKRRAERDALWARLTALGSSRLALQQDDAT